MCETVLSSEFFRILGKSRKWTLQMVQLYMSRAEHSFNHFNSWQKSEMVATMVLDTSRVELSLIISILGKSRKWSLQWHEQIRTQFYHFDSWQKSEMVATMA